MGNCMARVHRKKSKKHKKHDKNLDDQIAEFMKHVRPLDIIVFRGGDGVSNLIRKLEKYETGDGEISHVGVAISRKWCNKIKSIISDTEVPDDPDTLFCWESTLSGKMNDGVDNAETAGATFGVQLRVLEDDVRNYLQNPKANVGVCSLLDNPIDHKPDESDTDYESRMELLRDSINTAYDKYNGETYNANIAALLGALFPALRPLRWASKEIMGSFTDSNKWLFCSEFAATFYETIGVITDDTDGVHDGKMLDPTDIVPVDFLDSGADSRDEIARPICKLPPVWVKPLEN